MSVSPTIPYHLLKPIPSADLDTLVKLKTAGHNIIRTSHEIALLPDEKKVGRRFSMTEVERLTGLSRRTLFTRLKSADFPQGEQVGRTRKRMWTLEEVHQIQQMEGTTRGRNPETDKPVVLALSVFKGGVGKTTTAVNLSQYLAMKGYKVLLADLDAQGSATGLLGILGDAELNTEETALPIFDGDFESIEKAIRPTYWDGLDILPANLHLYAAEFYVARQLIDSTAKRERQAELGQAPDPVQPYYSYFSTALSRVVDRYDVVILDTPPAVGFVTTNALYAADALVVPVHPAPLDFASTVQFFELLSEIVTSFNAIEKELGRGEKRWDFIGLLATRYKDRDAHQNQILNFVRRSFGEYSLINHVVETKVLEGLGPSMKTAYEIEAYEGDRRTFERALDCLNQVNGEIEQLIRSLWPSHHEALAAELGVGK